MFKENDIIYIPKYKGTNNEFARIVLIKGTDIYVSNMNMPFNGTLAYTKCKNNEIQKRN